MEPLTRSQQDEVLELLHVAERHARRYAARSLTPGERLVSYDDYYLEGVIALSDCVRRRDPRMSGAQFLSYCDCRVIGAMKAVIRADIRTGKLIPQWVQEQSALNIDGAETLLRSRGIEPTPENIAAILDATVDEVHDARSRARREYLSLDGHGASNRYDPDAAGLAVDSTLQEAVAPRDHTDWAERFERKERDIALARAVSHLPKPQREAVHLRYIGGLSPRTIAARLHISESAVKHRLSHAKANLRRELETEAAPTRPAHTPHSR